MNTGSDKTPQLAVPIQLSQQTALVGLNGDVENDLCVLITIDNDK